jgi:hypothetical protein
VTRLFLAVLGALVLVPAAAAQTGDVTAMAMQIHNNAGREPMGVPRETHAFATCIAQRNHNVGILEELPHSREESGFVAGAFTHGDDNCHPRTRRMLVGGRFLRGATAEYLLEHPAEDEPADHPVFAMPTNEALERLDPNVRAPVIFIVIGECAARANLPGVMALLATEVGSLEERASLGNIMPSIAGCVPNGVTFRLPPLLIRGYLAEGALRNARAARVGSN